MTRSGVGRSGRTASRPAYAPPTGGWSSRLPSIQAAAERAVARAGRAALRFGLRTLVVAGFAGAAWLLCANAAQAADAPATDRTTDLSAVDLVRSTGLGGALAGAVPSAGRAGPAEASTVLLMPLTETVPPANQPALGSATARLVGGFAPPLSTATSGVLPGAAVPIPIAEPAWPAGATGWSTVSALPAGVSAPIGGRGDPGRGLSTQGLLASLGVAGRAGGSTPAADPTGGSVGLLTSRVTDVLRHPAAGWPRPVAAPVDRSSAVGRRSAAVPTWSPAGDDAGHVTGAGDVSWVTTRNTAGREITTSGSAIRQAGATAASATGRSALAGTGEMPVQPLPAPSRGWAPGGSTCGSSVPSEGGAYAVVSNAIPAGVPAARRQPVVAEVDAPRVDAVAPTVSPD